MTEFKEVTSPFCGIGTDDLTVQVDNLSVTVTENGCSMNSPAFELGITDTSPRVGGKEVDLDTAYHKAAELLSQTSQPVIGGCATDVNGMRALLSLADQSGAVVDHQGFNSARYNILTMQESGWINTTLAELKNRCDVLLVVGTDIEATYPRFYELFVWCQEAMFLEQSSDREIIILGKHPQGKTVISPTGKHPHVLDCSDAALPEVLSILRALLKNRPVKSTEVGGISLPELQLVADKLKQANYGVATWSAAALEHQHADLTVQTICELVKDLNHDTRFAGLPLGGRQGDQTAHQVSGWTTGYPARVRFSSGFPEYDPYLYDTEFMLDNGEADLLLWVQSLDTESAQPPTLVPTIVIGRSGMQFQKEPDVFIPVGVPGIDHSGHAYRLDSVVAIRLKQLRDSGLPSTADVLSAIQLAL
ncbi:MAG: formylmethanofuran dehydrogenase subunit B [Gammaproteobacteria bacterium]|nr:formylmethanofuran dehydrogenase subunit B [Gammaproteobacteria bacterium]